MRADRLVAVLLELQRRGRATVAEIASELEVSPRTIRRDLEALAVAGVPVYSQPGRGGGWSLLGGARTDLTGLRSDEAEALFLVAGPAANATPELKQALRKLMQALPEPLRASAEAASDAIVIDASRWNGQRRDVPDSPYRALLQRAIVDRRWVELDYDTPRRGRSTRMVAPLGLIEKAQVWYVVADTEPGMRLFRLSRIRAMAVTDQRFEPPPAFDLEATWEEISADFGQWWAQTEATIRCPNELCTTVEELFGRRTDDGGADGANHRILHVTGASPEAIAATIAGFGSAVEVRSPPEVRDRLAAVAAELTSLYGCIDGEGARGLPDGATLAQ